MSNRTAKYTAGEIGRVRVIEDFLPPPGDLVPREDNVKVTLSLSRRGLDFFKREAKKAPRALPAHDPRASGCVCGAAGGWEGMKSVRPIERNDIRGCLATLARRSRIWLCPSRARLPMVHS